MRFLSLEALEKQNVFLRRDYTHDFRGSKEPASLHMQRPPLEKLKAGVAEIREALAIPEATLYEIYTSVIDGKHILVGVQSCGDGFDGEQKYPNQVGCGIPEACRTKRT